MLKQRIITALILIPLTLVVLFYASPIFFAAVTGVLCLLAAYEWSALAGYRSLSSRLIYMLMVSAVFALMCFIPLPLTLMATAVWWAFALLLVCIYPRGDHYFRASPRLLALMGCFVILPCYAAVNALRAEAGGEMGVLYLFLLVFGADTTAYFAGKYLGRRKLLQNVSPAKTWEGFFAAMLYAFLLPVLVMWVSDAPHFIWPWVILISVVTAASSVLGDLFESLVKRVAQVKDSGQWLPGHGGIMDRIDSLTAAAPIFALSAYLLSRFL